MIRFFVTLLMTLGLLEGTAMAGPSLTSVLAGIQKVYGPLPGLSVSYEREVITRSMSLLGGQAGGDKAGGTIYFKHPHFLRMEQERPKPETIVANQDTLWWYIPDQKSVYQYSAKDFGKEIRLLSDIFRGLARVEDSFQAVLQGQSPSGGYDIDLIPDPPWQEIGLITVSVSPEYHVRGIKIYNTMGTVTHFRLGTLTAKKDFDEGFFRFAAPEGVKVVVEGKGQ